MKSSSVRKRTQANIATLKAQLSFYLKAVKAGEEVIVLEHRRPVAKLVPLLEEAPLLEVVPAPQSFSEMVDGLQIDAIRVKGPSALDLVLEERSRR